jgi:hypothetical protein
LTNPSAAAASNTLPQFFFGVKRLHRVSGAPNQLFVGKIPAGGKLFR